MRFRLSLILSVCMVALAFVRCNKEPFIPDDEDTVKAFTIPAYADDYSSISSWTNRNRWNLANVHDPSVAFYDGYY